MSIQIENTEQHCTMRVDGELTIYTAAECRQQLLDHLQQCDDLTVDLSAVSEMDSAGLQVLLVLKKQADKAGCGLQLVQHSPAVLEVFEVLDLQAHFGDPLVISAG